MTGVIRSGTGILFMKVGTHAQEELGAIIERKRQEISDAGYSMWGYGGNTCHPTTMVQPFARQYAKVSSEPIRLCMQPMNSKHFAEQLRADQYSVDGLSWQEIPAAINVLGSRYALCIRNLTEVVEELPLGQTRVAVGNSKGRPGSDYVRGRVDKACLEVVDDETLGDDPAETKQIGLVAELVKPYAVFLRNLPE